MDLLQTLLCVFWMAVCCVADVLHMPTSEGQFSKAKANFISSEEVAQLSVCLWVKSFNTNFTGTVFTINKKGSPIVAFGLVQFKGTTEGDLDNFVIVNNKRAPKPVKLEINDVRWHHICVTWLNLEGTWRVFLDGKIIGHGTNLMVNEVLSGEMELNFGGFAPEYDIYQFNGKITDAFVWNRPLSPTYVQKIYNCKEDFRSALTENLRGESKVINAQSWAGKAHLYVWEPNTIITRGLVEMQPNEPLCNPNVVVQCNADGMLISILKTIVDGLDVTVEDIHLHDSSCLPQVRGRTNGSIVFEINDLSSCGNKRTVNAKEVVYSNVVSNTPTLPFSLFIGQLFKMNVQCHYPVDIRVTMSSTNDVALIGKSSVVSAENKNLEAVSMLFKDETFAQVHAASEISNNEDKIYVGIALKDKADDEYKSDLKMVTEECWLATETQKIKLFKDQGCVYDQDGNVVSVIENGARDQTRFELSTVLIPTNTATYLYCAVRSCKGDECQRNCDTKRSRRDINEKAQSPSYSYISLGPIYRNTTSVQTKEQQDLNSESFPLYLVLAVVGLVAIAAITCTILLYFLCRRHRTISHGTDSLNSQSGNGKLRPRSASIGSLGDITLSSSFPSTLSIDLYGDDTSCSSLESNYYYYVNT